ncbi:MbcA/ParS/Xre antitoxin family protein [Methylomicrobium lacus]|uniref:MbcA/ParS/Xre antitoxin family protein n=1 Tax=Methylomicrobium lacus TaxID=136992 RepID=UPI00045EB4C4|nr:MbcA/ParS/Xre antitoxin family protein [Methylomicrobium lacus]
MLSIANSRPGLDDAMIAKGALRTFFNIADAWKLSTDEAMVLLGMDSRSTFFKWKKQPELAKLNPDKLERLSYIFGIYKALQILLPKAEAADQWIKRPNTAVLFQGKSALDRMLKGRVIDLYVVRQYLDGQRG